MRPSDNQILNWMSDIRKVGREILGLREAKLIDGTRDLEDLISDATMRLLRAHEKGIHIAPSYVAVTARNLLIDYLRRNRIDTLSLSEMPDPGVHDPSSAPGPKEMKDISTLLAKLPTRQMKALKARLECDSDEDAARQLDSSYPDERWTPKAVHNYCYLGRAHLRTLYDSGILDHHDYVAWILALAASAIWIGSSAAGDVYDRRIVARLWHPDSRDGFEILFPCRPIISPQSKYLAFNCESHLNELLTLPHGIRHPAQNQNVTVQAPPRSCGAGWP
jgi:DNA-directed RNA polymerase specialized sigma24 family protein